MPCRRHVIHILFAPFVAHSFDERYIVTLRAFIDFNLAISLWFIRTTHTCCTQHKIYDMLAIKAKVWPACIFVYIDGLHIGALRLDIQLLFIYINIVCCCSCSYMHYTRKVCIRSTLQLSVKSAVQQCIYCCNLRIERCIEWL